MTREQIEADILEALQRAPECQRGPQLYREASSLLRSGRPKEEAEKILILAALRCSPSIPEAWVGIAIDRAYKQEKNEAKNTQQVARESLEPDKSPATAGANMEQEQQFTISTAGWIKMHRRIREHWIWPKDRKYSRLEAWEDFLFSANHAPATIAHGFRLIHVQRGQFVASQMKLANRWRWHRETVAKFLGMLKADRMIDTETSNGFTLITILNYAKYQDKPETEPAAGPTADRQRDRQQAGSDTGINKKGKNYKNDERRERRTPFPADFSITEEITDWAKSNDLPSLDLESELEKFRLHCLKKGIVFTDWTAAFQSWLLKAPKFTRENGSAEPEEPRRASFWDKKL